MAVEKSLTAPRKYTEDELNKLRMFWSDGIPASQIAKSMGPGWTKNMVVGKVRRMGLAQRGSPINPRDPNAPAAVAAPKPLRLVKPDPVIETAPVFVRRERMSRDGCAWPLGDPKAPGFRFCGDPAPAGKPYCACHHRRAYIARVLAPLEVQNDRAA